MNHDSSVIISPARNISGSIRLPGDKSISHRYAMLAAIAQGTTRLENFSTGMDCTSTLNCLRALGCEWEQKDCQENVIEITGRGRALKAPRLPLDCGNSGSTMRMLSGIVAGQEFTSELVGDESLSRRPMARVIKPLTMMGAKISACNGDRPPLRITGRNLKAIDHRLPVASAQVKSALLFAGLFAEGETRVEEPVRTRDHGELVGTALVEGGRLQGATIGGGDTAALIDELPVLAAVAPFTEDGVEIRDAKELRVKESDRISAVATNLRAMGAQVEEREDGLKIPGRQTLHGAEIDSFNDHRIAMAFAVAALRAQGDTLIRGAQSAAISYPAFFNTLEDLTER